MSKFATITALLALSIAASAQTAQASDDHCTNAPRSAWHTIEEATAAASKLGYEVSRIETDDSCYEAYARTKDGRRVEVDINPQTLEIVRVEDKSR